MTSTERVARYAKLTAATGRGEELADALLRAAEMLESEPGCELYLVNRAFDDPDAIWVTELWRDRDALERSIESEEARANVERVKAMLAAPPELVELVPLGGLVRPPAPSTELDGFTLRNLLDVKDSAPQFGFGETGSARFATADLGAERSGVAHHRLEPGKRQAFGHRHERAEEVYVIVAGSGRAQLDDETVDLREHDALRVAPRTARAFEAGEDGLELVVFGPRHEGDVELLMGWWGESG
jgi:quinol monooxygenase YgiN/mannose-6-phosphate isomerase-like protein (cupin superfamily)